MPSSKSANLPGEPAGFSVDFGLVAARMSGLERIPIRWNRPEIMSIRECAGIVWVLTFKESSGEFIKPGSGLGEERA